MEKYIRLWMASLAASTPSGKTYLKARFGTKDSLIHYLETAEGDYTYRKGQKVDDLETMVRVTLPPDGDDWWMELEEV
jgi:hypothetical protein